MRFKVFVFLLLSFSLLSAGVHVLEETSNRIVVKITLDNMTIEEGSNFTYINVLDWTGEGLLGAPDMPLKMLNIAIPPNGLIKTKVLSKNIQRKMLIKPVVPVPIIRKGGKTFDYIYKIDQDLYSHKRDEMIQVQEETRAGFFTVIPIKFSPFNYNAASRELTYCDEIVLQIDITGDTSFHNQLTGKFENVYQDFILNYQSAKYWKTRTSRKINSIPFEKSDFWYKFELPQDGLYELTFEELSQLPSFCDPASVRILTMYREILADDPQQYFFKLKEVPVYIEDGNDGSFDKGDRIFFFRENYESPGLIQHSEKKIFWLTISGEYANEPLRLNEVKNLSTAERVENFLRRLPKIPSREREGIECIIIYPEQGVFEAQAQELKNLHSALVCSLETQANIFDGYGQIGDYVAIKSYLDSLYVSNQETLEYVILMGSGTRDWDPQNEKCKIMTYPIVPTDPESAVSDDRFVDFDNNVYPDLVIGRIPAKNDNDMDFYMERLTDYIINQNPGFWLNMLLIMADDEHKKGSLEGTSGPGAGMNHTARAEDVGVILNKGLFIDKVYGIEYNFDEYQNKPDARDAMLNKINEGRLIWYFIGHGNEDVLGDEDYFRGSAHLRLLQNIEHLPLFIAASCSVGKYDEPTYDCISEKLLFYDDGGSIASLAATASCNPTANTTLIKKFLEYAINEQENIGLSLFNAKHNSGAGSGNSRLYNILGDPILQVTQPEIMGSISDVPDSLRARELAQVNGTFEESSFINEIGEFRAYESEYDLFYTNSMVVGPDTLVYSVDYTINGNSFFNGEINITNGDYDAQFIVPDDVHAGEKGRLISYVFEDSQNKDYLNYFYPLKLSGIPVNATSMGSPQVQLWLESEWKLKQYRTFVEGDYVSTDPLLIAEIEDENGINILGSSGHKILLILDNSFKPIDVTSGFVYNVGSCTKGELSWQLNDLEEGSHILQLIVFDNFNNATVAETTFKAKSSGKVAIEQMLPFPNPMKKDGYFTFVITEDSDITISIYTITGRKIRTLKKPSCEAGYNQVYWDGRDGDGDEIANNTYFYKIKARQLSNSKVTKKIGKVIILK